MRRQQLQRLLQATAGDAQVMDNFRIIAYQRFGIERNEALETFARQLHQFAF